MLHQLDARGQHRDNLVQQEGRNQNLAKVAAHRDLTLLDNRLLHEGQRQGQHLEKDNLLILLLVCHLVSPPHCIMEEWFDLPEDVAQYRLDNSLHEAAAAASVAHRPWSASSCDDNTAIPD